MGTVLLLVVVGLVLFSSVLSIQDIVIEGLDEELSGRVLTYATSEYSGANLLFLRAAIVRSALAESFPETTVGDIERVWPRTVRIMMTPRVSLGTWCRASEAGRPCYYFDRTGATWGEAIPSSGTLLLTVIDERPEGDLQSDLLKDLVVLTDGIRELDVAVRQVSVQEGPLQVIVFESTNGFEMRFSRMSDIVEQLEVFGAFLSDRRVSNEVPTQYMDMTVPGKVYFQ